MPYVTLVRDGKTPSAIPAPNMVHHNFMVSNFGADGGCLDNDDGSSFYNIYENFCVYGAYRWKTSCTEPFVLRNPSQVGTSRILMGTLSTRMATCTYTPPSMALVAWTLALRSYPC